MKTTVVPHVYQDDGELPGTCRVCHIADPHRTNKRHQMPDIGPDPAEARRLGEREEDE